MFNLIVFACFSVVLSKGKVGCPRESTRDLTYTTCIMYGLYTGCIGESRAIFWEQLLGYPPKGTQFFPLMLVIRFNEGIRKNAGSCHIHIKKICEGHH